MTTNAYIFVWDEFGIESIIPITKYENIDKLNTWARIKGEEPIQRNPLDTIIRNLLMRARFNNQRAYEIYAVDCAESMDEEFWQNQWKENPQECANIVREKGEKLYSNRRKNVWVNIR